MCEAVNIQSSGPQSLGFSVSKKKGVNKVLPMLESWALKRQKTTALALNLATENTETRPRFHSYKPVKMRD